MQGPREMAPWSRPLDVDRLADNGTEVDFDVSLAGLPGLPAGVTGNVAGQARFARAGGFAVARLRARGAATLECQRCMQPMSLAIETDVQVGLAASEADVARVPEDFEPMLAPGGRISIGELIREELSLTLPIVALHAADEDCTAAPPEAAATEQAQDTHRPFARLAELLKR